MILTFDSCSLPKEVKIGWNVLDVRQYIPQPRMCFKCLAFNHNIKTCRATEQTCQKCGEQGHLHTSCSKPMNCANCGESHMASDRKCPVYQVEKEAQAYISQHKVTYRDAKKAAVQMFNSTGKTYSEILKRISPRRQPPQAQHISEQSQQQRRLQQHQTKQHQDGKPEEAANAQETHSHLT